MKPNPRNEIRNPRPTRTSRTPRTQPAPPAHPCPPFRPSPFCFLLSALCFLLSAFPSPAAAPDPYSIVNSKHNLSISGPGNVRATTESDICVFCHTPHSRTDLTPLWNHEMPNASYTPYQSSTLKATVGQPTGASKLCLSCHDGTVALGMVQSRSAPIPMRIAGAAMPPGRSRFGTDLSGHHPISFVFDQALANTDGELRDPKALQQEVRLDQEHQVQCTSCHDPHRNQYGQFLVKDNKASALCLDCHLPYSWNGSAHAISSATWNGKGRNPWPRTKGTSVAANGCENCHTPHDAGTKPELLNEARAEDNCLVCHNGTVATKDLTAEFNKPSVHPILTTGSLHDPAEGPLPPSGRHATCVDCHNPHATRSGSSTGVALAGSLVQVKGTTVGGGYVKAAAHEYEICFRCHASSGATTTSKVTRQFSQPNLRLQFNPANASYHPVTAPPKSVSSRTLLSEWTAARQILCTDCHNNDQGPGTKGAGPNGPHGSRYAPLLERNLVQTDYQPESADAYALCYKCHSEGVLMGDPLHSRHVRDQKTSCSTCHDPHGVQTQPHLINFNTLYVQPYNAQPSFKDLGAGRATCTLTCHGVAHNAKSYGK